MIDTLIINRIICKNHMGFVEKHILGLFGIILLLLYLVYYLLKESFQLGYVDVPILLIGIALCVVEFIPERIKISLNNYTLIPVVNKLISKYGSLFLCFLIIIGFYLRYNNLANLSFWVDELFTSYAAIGILEHGTPVMPSGMVYTRSILNTSLIALSFKILGVSEFSARIVSVVFGTLTIPLVYLMGVKVANKRVGLLAAILITFSVWEIVWAREARMYAQFQFFYLLTAYLYYLGFDKNNLKTLTFSVIAFICACLSHRLALTFLPVAVIYLLLYKREILKNQYFIYGSLALFGLISLYILVTGTNLLNFILLNGPIWGQQPFYYYIRLPDMMILFFLVVISSIISIILWKLGLFKNGRSYLYLSLNLFIPFIILSINPWKVSRYALFIFPFLVLSASYAIDLYIIQNVIIRDVCTRVANAFKVKKKLVRNVTFTISFMMITLLVVHTAMSVSVFSIPQKDHGNIHDGIIHSNWKKGGDFVEKRLVEGDIIITTLPTGTLYYSGQADYYIKQIEHKGIINTDGQLVEPRTGVIVLNTYDSFMQIVNNCSGWVIVDYKLDRYYTDPSVRKFIRTNMTFHPGGSDDTIEVYSWNRN